MLFYVDCWHTYCILLVVFHMLFAFASRMASMDRKRAQAQEHFPWIWLWIWKWGLAVVIVDWCIMNPALPRVHNVFSFVDMKEKAPPNSKSTASCPHNYWIWANRVTFYLPWAIQGLPVAHCKLNTKLAGKHAILFWVRGNIVLRGLEWARQHSATLALHMNVSMTKMSHMKGVCTLRKSNSTSIV